MYLEWQMRILLSYKQVDICGLALFGNALTVATFAAKCSLRCCVYFIAQFSRAQVFFSAFPGSSSRTYARMISVRVHRASVPRLC